MCMLCVITCLFVYLSKRGRVCVLVCMHVHSHEHSSNYTILFSRYLPVGCWVYCTIFYCIICYCIMSRRPLVQFGSNRLKIKFQCITYSTGIGFVVFTCHRFFKDFSKIFPHTFTPYL